MIKNILVIFFMMKENLKEKKYQIHKIKHNEVKKKIIYKYNNNINNFNTININHSFKIKEKLTLKKIKLNNLQIFTKNKN